MAIVDILSCTPALLKKVPWSFPSTQSSNMAMGGNEIG